MKMEDYIEPPTGSTWTSWAILLLYFSWQMCRWEQLPGSFHSRERGQAFGRPWNLWPTMALFKSISAYCPECHAKSSPTFEPLGKSLRNMKCPHPKHSPQTCKGCCYKEEECELLYRDLHYFPLFFFLGFVFMRCSVQLCTFPILRNVYFSGHNKKKIKA